MSGLILEGICASGKTTILKLLSQSERYIKKQTKIQLNEYMTERIIEYPRPNLEERLRLLNSYVDIIENLNSLFFDSRFKADSPLEVRPCYLLERFHLTHGVEIGDFELFKNIDRRLDRLDFTLVLLTINEDYIRKRLEDTFKRRPKSWYNYIMGSGGIDCATQKYKLMQNRLLEYSKESNLKTKIIDTTKGDWEMYIKEIEKIWDI